MASKNSFGAAQTLRVRGTDYQIFKLSALEAIAGSRLQSIPYCIKVLLENLLRFEDDRTVKASDIEYVAKWDRKTAPQEIQFRPARMLLQDFTGVPCVVDLAAMRDALESWARDPELANPLIPADLVIDHSVQVDAFGSRGPFSENALLEFSRNQERYAFLRWGQKAFQQFPCGAAGYRNRAPGQSRIPGECCLQRNVQRRSAGLSRHPDGHRLAHHDDQWPRRGGLGRGRYRSRGLHAWASRSPCCCRRWSASSSAASLPEGATATDLVLTVTQMLRKKGVVGKFVEFYGPGVSALSLADRATISNMAPEYGATIGFFPIDEVTLDYLRLTNRPPEQVESGRGLCQRAGPLPDARLAGSRLFRYAVARSFQCDSVDGGAAAPAGSHRASRRERELPDQLRPSRTKSPSFA